MQVPALPLTEHERLLALQLTGLLDTESEPRFDRITHLARLVLGSEIVLISLVDSERQWFKSKQGLDACETGRDISFCGHAILGHGIFEIPDTLLDSRFVDNPLVTRAPFIRFYAGVPLSRSGEQIGTLCFIDSKPRTLTAKEREIATEFAKTVEQEIEDRLQEQAHRQLAASELMYRSVLEGTRIGTWQWNVQTGETLFNQRWAEIVGYTLTELAPISIDTWLKLTHPEDLQKSEQLLKQHFAGELPFYECEARMRHKDGHWIWVLDRGKVGKWDRDGKPLIMYGTHQDISRSRQELDTYHHRAHHDVLTDLPNRVLLGERIQQALALAERENTHLAVLFMDLDGFKSVNDTHGHEAGDVVLKTVARRLLRCIRASDTLARVGGDEYVALLQHVSDEQEALKKASLFISEVRRPIPLPAGGEARISISVGIALYPQHGTTIEVLSEHADQAMYQVKKGSKNGALMHQDSGSV